jgi:6-pyruvoyl-tetrahydropterin synthase
VRVFAEHDSYGAIADFGELVAREEQIYADYDRALMLGRKASERMHARFKWSDCAARFVQICEKWSTIWSSRKERVDVALDEKS